MSQETNTVAWWRLLNRYQWFVLIVAAAGWLLDCMDQQLFNLARTPAMQELLKDTFAPDATPGQIAASVQEHAGYSTAIFLLGWATDDATGHHYYVRQMWDAKGSIDITALRPARFGTYAGFCGWALARAHARTGDSVAIHGYIGDSERFGESIADFAEAYADQTERDHTLLVEAIERGAVQAVIPIA